MSYSVQYRPRTLPVESRSGAMRPCIQRRWPFGVLPDALVFDVLARLRALQHRTQERGDVGRHHLERRLAVDLVLRLAHPVRERLVDERVVQALVEVRDRAGNVVGEQPQLRLLRLQRVANADVVLDVVPHDERAADAPAHLAIGEQRDAHPAQLARRAALAALVGDRRARERALDVALHFRQRVGRQEIAAARGRAGRRPARRSSRRTACWRSAAGAGGRNTGSAGRRCR